MAEDHPRSRGVYFGRWTARSPGIGSSPLARGLRLPHARTEILGRIIPARAGFTRAFLDAGGLSSDHPRSRGVYAGLHY